MPSSPTKREKGSAVLEFGIIISVLIPLLFGTIAFGVNLGNMLQAAQITRDIAHMYAKDVDFSTTANKNLAVSLVQGLGGMTVSGGDGVLILSQIRKVYSADCPNPADCPNQGLRVFNHRLVIGDITERTSNFGTPNGGCVVTSDGAISSIYYQRQAGCVASNFDDTILPQAQGDVAYVVEAYFATPNLSFLNASWSGGTATGGTTGTYMRAIF